MVSPAGLTAIKTISTMYIIHIAGMALCMGKKILCYINFRILLCGDYYLSDYFFDGQTPPAYRSSVECAETYIVGSLLYILECCCYNVSIALQRLPIFLHITSRIFF